MSRGSSGRWTFLRMLSGAVAVQALVSASNFIVGLFLVRRTSQVEYGYYVLITTAVLLASTLQIGFIQAPMVIRLTRSTKPQREDFIGGLLNDQRRLVLYLSILAAAALIILGFSGRVTWTLLAILVFGALAVFTSMDRNYFRMVLFAYRLPEQVLQSDLVYCALLIGGAFVATLTPQPAAAAALALALATLMGGWLLSRALWRREPWNPRGQRGALREIALDGSWSAFGGGVYWLFGQGYNYLVAAVINVSAVSSLSATRLFVNPVVLLSVGIGTLMLPITSRWNDHHRPRAVLGRLALFALGLDAVASVYFLAVWYARGWIFDRVLKRHFSQGDLLLLLWFAVALVTVLRDQLLFFLTTRGQFKSTSILSLMSAIVSLSSSYIMMRHIGAVGALLGLLIGETFNTAGILLLSLIEASRASGSPPSPHTLALDSP